jgi:hypothetical protein
MADPNHIPRIQSILTEWRFEPRPEDIFDLVKNTDISDSQITEVGLSIPELARISRPEIGLLKKSLRRSLPFFQNFYEELEDKFSNDTILFAGRDARAMYLYCKVISILKKRNSDRFIQVPGSREFYKLVDPGSKKAGLLFADLGISKQEILTGKKYIFVDTGFEGTVGLAFRKFADEILDVGALVSTHIPIILVSSYTEEKTVSQFKDMGKAPPAMMKEIKEYIKHKKERGIIRYGYVSGFSRVNDYIAIVMQNIPQYHGPYSSILSYKNRIIATSSDRGRLEENPPVYEINPDFINPVAALIIDMYMTKQIIDSANTRSCHSAEDIEPDKKELIVT